MEELMIPPAPNWYKSSVFICTPDNTLLYGARNNIVVIEYPKVITNVKIITGAHDGKVDAIAVDFQKWSKPDKLAVSVGRDKMVRLWDMSSYKAKIAHSGHKENGQNIVGVIFVENRVISVADSGFIIKWWLPTNELYCIPNLFNTKSGVSTVSACPHRPWLVAFGLHSGLIILADLRGTGSVVHSLRYHNYEINSFSWCPSPYNVFKKAKVIKTVVLSKYAEKTESKSVKSSDGNASENSENKNEASENSGENLVSQGIRELLENIVVNIEKVSSDTESDSCKTALMDGLLSLDKSPSIKNSQSTSTDVCQHSEEACDLGINKNEDFEKKNFATQDIEVHENIDVDAEGNFVKSEGSSHEAATLNDKINDGNISEVTAATHLFDCEHKTEDIDKEQNSGVHENTNASVSPADTKVLEIPVLPPKDLLLASICRNGSICIWRAGGDGRLQTEFTLPKKHWHRSVRRDNFGVICWVTPTMLLSSSCSSEVLMWNLTKQKKPMSSFALSDHTQQIFNITIPMQLYSGCENDNWRNTTNMWTTGKDRWILNTSLGPDRDALVALPSIGGMINAIEVSPIDPFRVAIGCGDETIRFWDIGHNSKEIFKMTIVSQNLKARITALAWHPVNESIIAFGTSEGRVGLQDTLNFARAPTILTQYHKSTVFQLCWIFHDQLKHHVLYTVAEGEIVFYDTKNKSAPEAIIIPNNYSKITAIDFKPDYSLLAIGHKDGSFEILNKGFEVVTTFYVQQKTLCHLAWHPFSADMSENDSEVSNWIAVASADTNVYVCECKKSDSVDVEGYSKKVVATLKGHTRLVSCARWSPHDRNHLVSIAEDGATMVWDVKTQTKIATIFCEKELLQSVAWHPLDPELIIVGARNFTLNVWNIKKHPPVDTRTEMPVIKHEFKVLRLKRKVADENETLKKDHNLSEKQLKDLEKLDKNNLLPVLSKIQNTLPDVNVTNCEHLLKQITTNTADLFSCELPVDPKAKLDPALHALRLFGGPKDISQLLEVESQNHKDALRLSNNLFVSLWSGNIANYIKECISSGHLNWTILSLSSMVSHRLWQDTCEAFAQKLLLDENYLDASTLFLACHNAEDAVKALCTGKLYREALVVANSRLPVMCPLTCEVLEKYAEENVLWGKFELAAQCYIKLGRLDDAAKMLAKRTDIEPLRVAMEIAAEMNNSELYEVLEQRVQCIQAEKETKDAEIVPIAASRFEAISAAQLNKGDLEDDGDNSDTNRRVEEEKDVENDVSENKCKKDISVENSKGNKQDELGDGNHAESGNLLL